MRYSQVRTMDISDGPGVRVALYTQGCPFHCDGCWNSGTWDFDGGHEYGQEVEDKIVEALASNRTGLSVLGGEPLVHQNLDDLLKLFKRCKETYPDKDIWIWSGFVYEEMDELQLEVLSYCDVLVDGRFDKNLKDLSLQYRGSSNQRVIHLDKERDA